MVTGWVERLLHPRSRDSAPAEVQAEELDTLLGAESPIVLLDIRSPKAYAQGCLPGAVNAPLDGLETAVAALDRAAPTVVY